MHKAWRLGPDTVAWRGGSPTGSYNNLSSPPSPRPHPPASWSLQCLLCGRTGKCQVEECARGQDLCRTTTLRIWEGELPTYTTTGNSSDQETLFHQQSGKCKRKRQMDPISYPSDKQTFLKIQQGGMDEDLELQPLLMGINSCIYRTEQFSKI